MRGVSRVEGRVLGPIELHVDGQPVAVSGPKQRAVVAMLAANAGHIVPVAALVDALWGDEPRERAEHTLQQHVSAVRKALAARAASLDPLATLATVSPGYVLRADSLDAEEFEDAATAGAEHAAAGRWADGAGRFDEALALWRGPALADARDTPRLAALATRWDERRLAVIEARNEARLRCGQAGAVLAELEHLVAEHPLKSGSGPS